MEKKKEMEVKYLPITSLIKAEYNPRKWSEESLSQLKTSIENFGFVDPVIINSHPTRKNIVLGGHMRLEVAKELGLKNIPTVSVKISDLEKEKELNIRLNKNTGEFDFSMLAEFDENFLSNIGFSSEEMDSIFGEDDNPEMFDLSRELERLDIKKIEVKKGDVYEFTDGSRLMNGDSMSESDMFKLMDGAKADLCLTDPPYLLDYLRGKTRNKDGITKGFGSKKNRIYLGTETLPDNFTELWMCNIAKIAKPDFSIIIFENPKNLRTIWNELEKHWRYRNTITWHVPNRMQGFSAKHKFFNKTDIALVGTKGSIELNLEPESDELFQNEYENAIFATTGKPHWESYEKGKKICPTDFISHVAADRKSSGQGIIFGTKPVELLIPYLKVLTKRDDLVVEPFGGSGSTGATAIKLGRKFRMMEKSDVYTEVIKRRIEKLLESKAKKIL